MRPWLRLERDWDANAKVRLAAKRGGAPAVLGWVVLLGRACQSDGFFPSREHVELAVVSPVAGITDKDAEHIVDVLLAVGLVDTDGDGFRVHDWVDYQPPMRYLSGSARGKNLDNGTGRVEHESERGALRGGLRDGLRDALRDGMRDDVRTNVRTNERTNEQITYKTGGTNQGGQKRIDTRYPIGDALAGQIADLVRAKSIKGSKK